MDAVERQEPFEYHTFLHHSQTADPLFLVVGVFEYHTFLHHSQTADMYFGNSTPFEYHTFLHHSQTCFRIPSTMYGLNTIHFYIILKPFGYPVTNSLRLNTIHFYIILKQ